MAKNKLGIIGGSGLYEIEGLKSLKWKTIKTPWGNPSAQIINFKYKGKEVCFLPRHARGHKISPSNINFRANIDALKQLGVTDIISVSAVGSLKENLDPGTFVLVDQFIDRTFSRIKTFFDEEIVAHVSMAHPTSVGLANACENALKQLKIKSKDQISTTLRALDKIDRLGWKEAEKLLGEGRKDKSGDYTKGANLKSDQIKIIENALKSKTTDSEDILEIVKIFQDYNFKNYKFDPSVIRGLEYYTGPIFEVNLNFEVKNL